jgi:lipopolysaccharide/colanic/teichoic acid biosynthesis glycosyltransferase
MTLPAFDRYFRRGDSLLAGALRVLEASTCEKYSSSSTRRALDLAAGVPAALFGLPVVFGMAVANKGAHPLLPAFFVQERAGQGSPLKIVKLRTMLPRDPDSSAPQHVHEVDRVTLFGRVMRRYYLDEVPQLLLVLNGKLSLVGIRVLPVPVYEHLRSTWSAARFERWSGCYATSRLGLTGLHQVYRRSGKEDSQRFHRDVFYARRASLGFDLYLLWKTLERIVDRIWAA